MLVIVHFWHGHVCHEPCGCDIYVYVFDLTHVMLSINTLHCYQYYYVSLLLYNNIYIL